VACHFIYVVAFGRLFGEGAGLATAAKKVVADQLFHVPLMYFPVYFGFMSVTKGGSLAEARERWSKEVVAVTLMCWKVFIPFQTLNFTLIPPHARIAALALCNVAWMIILSSSTNTVSDPVASAPSPAAAQVPLASPAAAVHAAPRPALASAAGREVHARGPAGANRLPAAPAMGAGWDRATSQQVPAAPATGAGRDRATSTLAQLREDIFFISAELEELIPALAAA